MVRQGPQAGLKLRLTVTPVQGKGKAPQPHPGTLEVSQDGPEAFLAHPGFDLAAPGINGAEPVPGRKSDEIPEGAGVADAGPGQPGGESGAHPFTNAALRKPWARNSINSTPSCPLGAEATTLQGFFSPSALYKARGT